MDSGAGEFIIVFLLLFLPCAWMQWKDGQNGRDRWGD